MPNTFVDITPVMELKRKAMGVMQAQSYLQTYYAELGLAARQPCPAHLRHGGSQVRRGASAHPALGGEKPMNSDELQRLSELGVATVYEASGREGLIDAPLIQLFPAAGWPARRGRCLCGQDDNLMVHAAIEHIQPGEVVVLTMPEPSPVALVGELLATQVKVRRRGRDSGGRRQCGMLRSWSNWACPSGRASSE